MKKIIGIFAFTALLSISLTSTALADVWKQDSSGWKWQDDDNSYPVSEWKWIDSDGDGLAECYYFDENGYLLTNTSTPDGYQVNDSGEWTESGLIRQKAVTPFAAKTMREQGKKLYREADLSSSNLPGLDINADININLSYGGLSIPVLMNMKMKYHDINTPAMEYYSSVDMDMMGISQNETSFYTNGIYYSDRGENERFKMRIGYSDLTRNITFGGLTGQFGAFLNDVQIATDDAGNKILIYSSKTEGLEKYLTRLFDEIWPTLSFYDYQIEEVDGTAVITPEGYFSKENISIKLALTEDDDTLNMTTNINLDYNNPGQAVTMSFPSTEGYEEIVY